MSTIPLPALAIKPPEQPDVLSGIQKLYALRSMQQQQQTQQQEQQIRAQQITDQQATTAAMKNWDGKSYDDLSKSILDNGGSATAAQNVQLHGLNIKKQISDIAAQDATTGSKNLETFIGTHRAVGDALEPLVDPKVVPDADLHQKAMETVTQLHNAKIIGDDEAQQAAQVIQTTQDPTQLRSAIDAIAKTSMGAKAIAEQHKTESETSKDTAQASEASATAQQKQAQTKAYADLGLVPGVPADEQSMMNYLRTVKGATPAQWPAYKAAKEAAATQPYKIQTAQAEGQARQLVEGMGKSVYAFNPDGSRELMSQTDALKKGLTMVPVTEKNVGDDIQLVNRLGDVRQKLARYEQSLSNIGTSVNSVDQSNLAALIGKDSLKVDLKGGAFGTELPMSRVNALLQKENISNLSDDAKKLLVSYYNARESMQGYQRVLSGTGRANEKAMELNLDALPNPGTSDKAYAGEALKQFRENLGIVGQGLPKIPGIKSPEQIESEAASSAPAKTPPATTGAFSWDNMPQYQQPQ
ncbi:MAG: hypothetical protein ACRD20_20430 [Terriglobales bacterium]